ncbi:MAG: YhbY family RNA-binding protein [Asgard group archaeon]|nr:YhbY family RNA-binding protein [Asgard group archaeon]
MTFQLKKKLKNRIATVLNEKAKVQIGKKGLTPAIYTEICNQLAIHELIKVRFLNNYLTEDINQDITLISKKTNSQIVDKRGKTVLLYKPKVE